MIGLWIGLADIHCTYLRYCSLVRRVDELWCVVVDVWDADNNRNVAFLARRSDRTRNLQFTNQLRPQLRLEGSKYWAPMLPERQCDSDSPRHDLAAATTAIASRSIWTWGCLWGRPTRGRSRCGDRHKWATLVDSFAGLWLIGWHTHTHTHDSSSKGHD